MVIKNTLQVFLITVHFRFSATAAGCILINEAPRGLSPALGCSVPRQRGITGASHKIALRNLRFLKLILI